MPESKFITLDPFVPGLSPKPKTCPISCNATLLYESYRESRRAS